MKNPVPKKTPGLNTRPKSSIRRTEMPDKEKSTEGTFKGIDDSKLDEEWGAIVDKAIEIAKAKEAEASKGKTKR